MKRGIFHSYNCSCLKHKHTVQVAELCQRCQSFQTFSFLLHLCHHQHQQQLNCEKVEQRQSRIEWEIDFCNLLHRIKKKKDDDRANQVFLIKIAPLQIDKCTRERLKSGKMFGKTRNSPICSSFFLLSNRNEKVFNYSAGLSIHLNGWSN